MASKDDNGAPLLYGISAVDGVTPVQIKFNPNGGGMKVDFTSTISFTPELVSAQTDNDFPIAKGVSDADGETILPWYVNPSTGGVLIDM